VARFADLAAAEAHIAVLEQRIASTEDGSVADVVKQAAAQLRHFVEELVTVRVLTIVGEDPLKAELLAQKDGKSTGFATAGATGAITSINMASGDIQTFLSQDAVDGPIKALHDEALARGTAILRENARMLADVIGKLASRAPR
jgi:hypothetical protein